MSGRVITHATCPNCGQSRQDHGLPPVPPYRPWQIRDRKAVKLYLQSLGEELNEWLLALFVDEMFNLLSVETIDCGDVSSCKADFTKIVSRGLALRAAGFILAHNHPSGDPRPSSSDVQLTMRLAHVAKELEMPLLDHVIVAGDQMISVGCWGAQE